MEDKYYAANQVVALYPTANVSTLRSWANDGRVKVKRSPGGKRFYNINDVRTCLGFAPEQKEDNRETIGYARVSSAKQKQDLERQIQYIRDHYETNSIIQDISSGLNFNRSGLQSLLTKVESGSVGTVVVTHRDRLCRFGIEFFERILRTNHTELLVLCEEEGDEEQELATDLFETIGFFVAKRNGRRCTRYQAKQTDDYTQVPPEAVQERQDNTEAMVPLRKTRIKYVRRVVRENPEDHTDTKEIEGIVSYGDYS